MNVQQSDLIDPALVAEVGLARAAAQEEAGDERVGDYVEYQIEDSAAVTHLFEADKSGYRGWRWAVTITSAGPASDVTVSEVVLLPGPTALVAPEWIPWQQRVQAGDLGVGDLLPTSPDDPRLVPAYVASDDPAVEEVAAEAGLGRVRVMSRPARLDAADRWQQSEFGPRSDMARSAPAHCATCGFYLPLAGALRAAFGTCGNEFSPADGHVVHVEYGCGAHSEAEVEQVSPVLVADLIYDDAQLDVEPLVVVDEVPSEAPPANSAASDASDVTSVVPDESAAPGESDSGPVEAADVPVVAPEAGEAESAVESAGAEPGSAAAVASDAVDSGAAAGEPLGGSDSDEAEGSDESDAAVDSAEAAVAEAPDSASAEAVEESAGSGEDTSGEPGPAGSGEPGVTPAEEPGSTVAAVGDEQAGSAPVAGSSTGDDVAPAAIEPVVTGETTGNDESAFRE